jgi:hypothetical protein
MNKLETLKKAWDNAPLGMKKHFFIITEKNAAYMSKLFKVDCKSETIKDRLLTDIKQASILAVEEAKAQCEIIQKY